MLSQLRCLLGNVGRSCALIQIINLLTLVFTEASARWEPWDLVVMLFRRQRIDDSFCFWQVTEVSMEFVLQLLAADGVFASRLGELSSATCDRLPAHRKRYVQFSESPRFLKRNTAINFAKSRTRYHRG